MPLPSAPDPAALRSSFAALLGAAPAGTMRQHHVVVVPSDRAPWLDTGIELAAGEKVTTLVAGRTFLKGTGLSFGADFQVWLRIGKEGEIFRGTRASNSFTVTEPGRLYVASYFPGEWATRSGSLATSSDVYAGMTGDLILGVIRWQTTPLVGLKALSKIGDVDGLIASEIDRLTHAVAPPEGWEYLWFIGPAETYRACRTDQHEHAVCCTSRDNAALLHKDVALPLLPNTRLRWSWRMEQLPSKTREDTLPTHDYLSIAVEFDNGQDITYFWSSELPVDMGFRCPIPTWTARETHIVARSGLQGLGQWFDEERDVHADYAAKIGSPVPGNIVRV